MSDVVFRRADVLDAAFLANARLGMFRDMMPEKVPADPSAFLSDCRDYYELHANNPLHFDLIAECDGRAFGSGGFILEERPPHVRYGRNICAYVLNVYVLPDYRRRGIARRLMERLMGEARARGAVKIGLHASDFGRGLYESLGFQTVQRYLEWEERVRCADE